MSPFFLRPRVFAWLRVLQCVSHWAVAAPRLACHLHYVDSHRTTGVNGGLVLLVAGASGARVWGGPCGSLRAGGADRGTDGIGVEGLAPSSHSGRSYMCARVQRDTKSDSIGATDGICGNASSASRAGAGAQRMRETLRRSLAGVSVVTEGEGKRPGLESNQAGTRFMSLTGL